MKPSSFKNSMIAGLLVTALLTPPGVGSAAASSPNQTLFALKGTNPEAFLDLKTVSPDRMESIRKALELGLLEGDAGGRFRPDDLLTRQELAALLARALQLPVPSNPDSFEDVVPGSWSGPYIAAVKAAGIMEGDGQGRFRPGDVITREEIAVTLVRASQMALYMEAAPSQVSDWQDVGVWAQAFVRTALGEGILSINQGQFSPKEHVLRADVAEMLISAFFPADRASVLQELGSKHVRLNGVAFELSEAVKGILQESNREILQGAKLKFRSSGRTLEAITELHLVAGGSPAAEGEAEFSRNLELDGHGAVLDGHLKVAGDFTSVFNLTVNGDLHIGKELQHDFSASKLTVRGKTVIDGGDDNTVVFQDSSLQSVDVNKENVRVVAGAGTTVESVTVQTNATIATFDSTIGKVTIATGAQAVELQGSLPQVTVTSLQPVVLSGTSTIGQLAVNSPSQVTLNGTGTVSQLQVNNAGSTITVGAETKVETVSATNGATAAAVQNTAPVSEPEPNTPPRYEVPIVAPKLTVGDPSVTIDLSKHFKDSQQITLRYTAVSLKSTVMKAAVAGNLLTLTPVGRGTTTIRINANDLNGGSLNADLAVTVNGQPKVGTAPSPMTLTAGQGDGRLDLASTFLDEDGDPLTFEAVSSDPSVAAVSLSGDILTVTAAAPGSTVIQLSASDGRGGKTTASLPVTVNQAPVLREVPEAFIQLGTGPLELDLAPYVSDRENELLTVSAEPVAPGIITVKAEGSKLILTPVKAGRTAVSVTVKDPHQGEAKREIQVTVNSTPSVLKPLTDLSLTVGQPDGISDLSGVFDDPDQDVFGYEAISSHPFVASVSEAGGRLTVHPVSSGRAIITVKAKDGKYGEAVVSFQVTVNEAPVIGSVPGQLLQVGAAPLELDWTPYIKDAEQDPVKVTAVTEHPDIAQAAVSGMKVVLTALSGGTTKLTITADDRRGGTAAADIPLTVNTAPAARKPGDLKLTVGQPDGELQAGAWFQDPDRDDVLSYEVHSSAPSVADVSESDGRVTIKALASGTAVITIKATDGRGGTASTSFGVTVNEPPAITSIPGQILQRSAAPRELDISTYLTDPENDALVVTAQTDDPAIAAVSVSGHKLTLAPAGAGQTRVRIMVDDGKGGTAETSFSLLVNREPGLQQTLEPMNLTVGAADGTMELAAHFGDADQDALTYEAVSSKPAVAQAALAGERLTVHAVSSGTAEVTVKAKDGKGGETETTFLVVVNEAPVLSAVPVQYLQLGAPVMELDLAPYVEDKEQDAWTMAVDGYSAQVLKVAAAGTKLSLEPVAAGKTEVALVLTDSRGGVACGTVYVEVNTAPAVVQTVRKLVVTAGQAPGLVDLIPVFTDADSDTLSYEVVSSQPAVADGNEAGGQLTVAGLKPGTAVVTVKAKDGRGGEASTSFEVEVNEAPKVQSIPDQLLQVNGAPLVLDLLPYVSDRENDAMTLSATTNNAAIASVQSDGFQLTVVPAGAGSAQIQAVVTDSRGGVTKATVNIAVNTVPERSQNPGPQMLTVGSEDGMLDLPAIFSDADLDPLTYQAVSSDPSVAAVQVDGGKLKTRALKSGTAVVHVTASDGRGGQTAAEFTVTVNESPAVTAIPLQRLTLPGEPRLLDLAGYISDTEQDTLTVTEITYDASIVSLSLQDLMLNMTPVSLGETTVTLSVYDGRGGTAPTSFPLRVTLPNRNPVILQPLEPMVLTVGQPDITLDLATLFSDPDQEDTLAYEAVSGDPSVASAVLAGSQVTVRAIASGSADITLTAGDGQGGQTSLTWKVTVNAAPVIHPVAEQIIWLHEGEQELDLALAIADPDAEDAPNLMLSAVSSDPSVASVTVNGRKLAIKPEAAGTAKIGLAVSDGRGGKALADLTVTVKQNQNPAIASIPEQILKAGTGIQNLDLTPYLSDPDPEDAQSLTVTITAPPDPDVATASVSGRSLNLDPIAVGKTTVQLTVSDGRGGTASASLAITVNPAKVNQAPVATGSIREQVLTPGVTNTRTFDLAHLFSDANGDPLTFTAVSASPAAASVSVAGSLLTLTPGAGSDSAIVTVTADDGDGGTATLAFTVRTAQLVTNGRVNVVTKIGVKESVTYDLSTLFPGQTSFKLYQGTADATTSGPTTLNGNVLTLADTGGAYTWVVGADGRAAVFQFSANSQGTPVRFFSEYLDGGDGRMAIEISYSGTGDPDAMKGYSLEVHRYMKKTQTKSVTTSLLMEQYADPYIYISSTFYDLFDLTTAWYYNDELMLYNPTEFNLVALVLKRYGQVVDVLGDPSSISAFLPAGGTLVRKSGIYTGSPVFSQAGEWNTYPKGSYQFLGRHTK